MIDLYNICNYFDTHNMFNNKMYIDFHIFFQKSMWYYYNRFYFLSFLFSRKKYLSFFNRKTICDFHIILCSIYAIATKTAQTMLFFVILNRCRRQFTFRQVQGWWIYGNYPVFLSAHISCKHNSIYNLVAASMCV